MHSVQHKLDIFSWRTSAVKVSSRGRTTSLGSLALPVAPAPTARRTASRSLHCWQRRCAAASAGCRQFCPELFYDTASVGA